MGSSCDDGLKNAEVTEGLEGALPGYAPSYHRLEGYDAERAYRGNRGASSQALIERTVEASVLTALLRRHGTLHPPLPQVPESSKVPETSKVFEHSTRAGVAFRQIDPPAEDFERFIALLSEGDCPGALAVLTPWRHPFGLLDDRIAAILGAAAQRLGRAWEDDRLCFAEVSLGLVTLQRLLHEFAPPTRPAAPEERRMLLVPMPGEGHCFGLRMLGIRFQQAGWDCHCEAATDEAALLRRVAGERFDVIGLSVQDIAGEGRAAGLIARLRLASRRKGVRILLGGAPFVDDPQKAIASGADLPALPFSELSDALDRLLRASGP